MRLPLTIAALALGVAIAPAAHAQKNERVYVVYGDDACPEASGNDEEIVVCARRPEEERYRVPKTFRKQEISPQNGNESWAVRAQGLNDAAPRSGPGSCSAIGPGGWTGCFAQALKMAQEQGRATIRANNAIPGNRDED